MKEKEKRREVSAESGTTLRCAVKEKTSGGRIIAARSLGLGKGSKRKRRRSAPSWGKWGGGICLEGLGGVKKGVKNACGITRRSECGEGLIQRTGLC